MAVLEDWHEAYTELAILLDKYYTRNNTAQVVYDLLKDSEFFSFNSSRFSTELKRLKEEGLDPIQIFSAFNYSGIKNETRVTSINLLFKALFSDFEIDSRASFEGIPSPIITKLIRFRGWTSQNEIWDLHHKVVNAMPVDWGLEESDWNKISSWSGVEIASLTMYLFWINSERYLPLDRNTVRFIIEFRLVNVRPKTESEYYDACHLAKVQYDRAPEGFKSILRSIVKDAYKFVNKDNKEPILSGDTRTVLFEKIGHESTIDKLEEDAQKRKKEFLKGFCIIALKTHDESAHLKNLDKNTLYQFYNAYEFVDGSDDKIKYYDGSKVDLYSNFNKEGNINLNITVAAVVGKNGSGKSSLLEMLYLIINKLSIEKKIASKDLIDQHIKGDLYFNSNTIYKLSIGQELRIFEYDFNEATSTYTKNPNAKSAAEFDIEKFCYTTVVNYSLYGLNSRTMGDWIDRLFHKNDGYQVPIVINPKRDEGQIDINNEEDLAKSRLLSLILEPDLLDLNMKKVRPLVPGKTPYLISLSLDQTKFDQKIQRYKNEFKVDIVEEDVNKVIEALGITFVNDLEYETEAREYIYLKLISIAHNYPTFQEFRDLPNWINTDNKRLLDYVSKVNEESSHITFKLRQAINYLKYGLYSKKTDYSIFDLSNDISNARDKEMTGKLRRTINFVPPSFFKTDIVFEKKGKFEDLSSGEKQQILSINTVAYQLFNVDSVTEHKDSYKYGNFNIVFDEVELYFHPDFQRTYISNLLTRINDLVLEYVDNINILFITHSPFILSDIPISNILKLKDGHAQQYQEKDQTFGANIHDLLANEFFMENGFMGELSKNLINDTINYLKLQILKNDLKHLNPDDNLFQAKSSETKQLETEIKRMNEVFHRNLINIIGEPLIKSSLDNLYREAFPNKRNKEEIQKEIDFLTKEMDEL